MAVGLGKNAQVYICQANLENGCIWYAIAFCDESLVQVILERGSDIRMLDYKQFSPFSLAIAKEPPKSTLLLLVNKDLKSRKTLLENINIRNHLLYQAVHTHTHTQFINARRLSRKGNYH